MKLHGTSLRRTLPRLLLGLLGGMAVAAPGAAGAPLYPDLRAIGPSSLGYARVTFGPGDSRWILGFRAHTYNRGPGAFELNRVPNAEGAGDINQRVFDDTVGFIDEKVGTRPLEPFFSYEILRASRYEVWTEKAFRRAEANGFRRGTPLVTIYDDHCYADVEQVNPDIESSPLFYVCGPITSGISVGWANNEEATFDDGIDFGPTSLPDGGYFLRAVADPDNVFFESPAKSDPNRESEVANSGHTFFRLINSRIAGA